MRKGDIKIKNGRRMKMRRRDNLDGADKTFPDGIL
jgi:hypothetical protein